MARVQSLVEELRSRKPCGVAQNKQTNKQTKTIKIYFKKSTTNKTATRTSVLKSVGQGNVVHKFEGEGMANQFSFVCFSSICYRSVKIQKKSKPSFISVGHRGFCEPFVSKPEDNTKERRGDRKSTRLNSSH